MENEIAGSYPIIFDGMTEGDITVSREGLFWNFEAKCNMRNEIVRLSVYGDENEGYLGVMEPCGDMLKLTKKLSRTALSAFPQAITHGGQKGEPTLPSDENIEVSPEVSKSLENDSSVPLPYAYDNFSADNAPLENEIPPPVDFNVPQPMHDEIVWHPCAVPCSLFSGIVEKKLCGYIKGAYLAQVEDFMLLAVPESIAKELSHNDAIHFINEINIFKNTFLICKIKHGKSVSEP